MVISNASWSSLELTAEALRFLILRKDLFGLVGEPTNRKRERLFSWPCLFRGDVTLVAPQWQSEIRMGGANILAELFERIVLPHPDDHGWDLCNVWKELANNELTQMPVFGA